MNESKKVWEADAVVGTELVRCDKGGEAIDEALRDAAVQVEGDLRGVSLALARGASRTIGVHASAAGEPIRRGASRGPISTPPLNKISSMTSSCSAESMYSVIPTPLSCPHSSCTV